MAKDAKGHGSEKRGGTSHMDDLSFGPGNPYYSDATAAAALAAPGHPKSTPAPVHPDAAGRSDFGPGHTVSQVTLGGKVKSTQSAADWASGNPRYSRAAVDNAIASSNRHGRRIGGREAKAIHALLKGRY